MVILSVLTMAYIDEQLNGQICLGSSSMERRNRDEDGTEGAMYTIERAPLTCHPPKGSKYGEPPAGLEPAILGLGGRCLIHWATEAMKCK